VICDAGYQVANDGKPDSINVSSILPCLLRDFILYTSNQLPLRVTPQEAGLGM